MKRVGVASIIVLFFSFEVFSAQELPCVIRRYYDLLQTSGQDGSVEVTDIFAANYEAFRCVGMTDGDEKIAGSSAEFLRHLCYLKKTYKGWESFPIGFYKKHDWWYVESRFFTNTGEVFFITTSFAFDNKGLISLTLEQSVQQEPL